MNGIKFLIFNIIFNIWRIIMFRKNAETQVHGSIRKTKAYGAVGVATLFVLLGVTGATTASADEVVTPAEATPVASAEGIDTTDTVVQPVADESTSPEVVETPVASNDVVAQPVEEFSEAPEVVTNANLDGVVVTGGSTKTVDTTERQEAVSEATSSGVKVVTSKTVNLGTASTAAEELELQSRAKSDINRETASVNEVTNDYNAYKAEMESYKKEVAKQIENASANSSNFGGDRLRAFLNSHTDNGDSLRVLNSSVLDKSKISNDFSRLDKVTNINDVLKDFQDRGAGYKAGTVLYGHYEHYSTYPKDVELFKLRVGDKLSYTGLFGDDVVTTFTVKDFKPAKADGVDYLLTSIRRGSPSFDTFGGGELKFDVSFTDKNGQPLKGDYVVGFGDVDGTQAVKLDTAPSAEILGSSISKLANHTYISDSSASALSSEPEHQVWFLFNDVSGFTYTYGFNEKFANPEGLDNTTWRLAYTSVWHEVGGVDIGFNPAVPPVTVLPNATINTYTYDTVGTVTTTTVSEDGTVIIPKTPAVDKQPTGSSYDVSAHEDKIVTPDGKTYKFVSVTPNDKGTVTIGETNVVFTYKELKGTVVIDYQSKEGETLSARVVDTPESSTGVSYDTTDNKPVIIVTLDGRTWQLDPSATRGAESGKVAEGETRVVYIYDEVKGDVTVNYTDENGNVIKQPIKDMENTSTGVDYDTTDNKPAKVVTETGRTYQIVPDKTKGNEFGRVSKEPTNVTYVYTEVFGDVTVHYVNEKGEIIKQPVKDVTHSSTGVSYDTTDNKPTRIVTPDEKTYRISPDLTKGSETGKVAEGNTDVTYVYHEVFGSVIVKYVNEKGETIAPNQVDEDNVSTGVSYDTTDHKTRKIVTPDGKTYAIDPSKTKGVERGKVVEGDSTVTYIYTEVLGDVTVHYEDKKGNPIKSPVIDTKDSSTGVSYDTSDHKPAVIKVGDKQYNLVPELTEGSETGKVAEGNTDVTYVYKRVGDVTVTSVSNTGEVLVPKVLTIDDQEVGTDYDASKHKDKIVLEDGRTFKFVKSSENATGKITDGVQDVIHTYDEVLADVVVKYEDKDGNEIKNPVTDISQTSIGTVYKTADNKPSIIEHKGVKYVLIPELTKGDEEGKVVEGGVIVTYVYNKLEAHKGVLNDKGDNIDGKSMGIGDKGSYALTGASVRASLFDDGKGQYDFEDDLDEKHDKFLSSALTLVKGIVLEDGTVIKSGADLLKYAKESYDGNIYRVSLNSDFLKSIANDLDLQVLATIKFERISEGEVKNTFKNIVNGEEVVSNTAITKTKKPAEPVPAPTPQAPVAPQAPQAPQLPTTGDDASASLAVAGLGILSLIGLAGAIKRKRLS